MLQRRYVGTERETQGEKEGEKERERERERERGKEKEIEGQKVSVRWVREKTGREREG